MIINPNLPTQNGLTLEQVQQIVNAAMPDISGKLDKTATAAAATKLATSRTIRTNLASTSADSFDGTANVTPGVTGVLPVANGGTGSSTEKYLPLAGGTITGDLRLKGSGNYGNKINLGDGDYVHFYEPTDDCLEIKARQINFVTSDTSGAGFTRNGNPLGGGGIEITEGTVSFSREVLPGSAGVRVSDLSSRLIILGGKIAVCSLHFGFYMDSSIRSDMLQLLFTTSVVSSKQMVAAGTLYEETIGVNLPARIVVDAGYSNVNIISGEPISLNRENCYFSGQIVFPVS